MDMTMSAVVGVLIIGYACVLAFLARALRQRNEAQEGEKKQYDRYVHEYATVQEKNAAVNELTEALRVEKVNTKALREENDSLRTGKKTLGERIDKLNNELTDAKNNIGVIDDARRTAIGQKKRAEKEKEDLRQAGKEAAKLACDRKQEIDKLVGDIADRNKEIDTLKGRIKGYLKECGEKGLEIGTLKTLCEELRTDLAKVVEEKKSITKERDKQASRAVRAERAHLKAVDKRKGLQEDLTAARAEIEAQGDEIAQLEQDGVDLAAENEKLTAKLGASKKREAGKAKTIGELEQRIAGLQESLADEKGAAKLVKEESKRTIDQLVGERDAARGVSQGIQGQLYQPGTRSGQSAAGGRDAVR